MEKHKLGEIINKTTTEKNIIEEKCKELESKTLYNLNTSNISRKVIFEIIKSNIEQEEEINNICVNSIMD
jgi:hypothetical protein